MSKFIIIDNINSPLLAKKLRKCHYNYISNNLIIQYKKNLKIPLHELFSIDYLEKNVKQNKLEHYLICYLIYKINRLRPNAAYVRYFINTITRISIAINLSSFVISEKIIAKILKKYNKINNVYYFHHFKIIIFIVSLTTPLPYMIIFYQ